MNRPYTVCVSLEGGGVDGGGCLRVCARVGVCVTTGDFVVQFRNRLYVE